MERYRKKDKTYIIAEIGVNHDGSVEKAKQLIDLAKASGADAVKFQCFRAEDIATVETPKVKYQVETTGHEQSHYEMLRTLELSFEDNNLLINYCKNVDIAFISTPYSLAAVEQLERLGVSEYKIASADIVDIPLLKAVAATGKPVILSLGMANLGEIERALACFKEYAKTDIVLLHCVSNYPCSDSSLNLSVIKTLRTTFQLPVGFSDHSVGTVAALVSVALGGSVVEKHFTSDKMSTGPDHRASSEPDEFKCLVNEIRRVEEQLGSPVKLVQTEELGMALTSRKSLVFQRSVEEGESFQLSDFTMKRPGNGLRWEDTKYFIGQQARARCEKDRMCRMMDIK